MSIATRLNRRLTELARGQHLRHQTVRVRLTLLYGGLFLLSGAALVAITYVLFQQATEYTKPQLPRIPHAPTIQRLTLLPPQGPGPSALSAALPQLAQVQDQLARNQRFLVRTVHRPTGYSGQPLAENLAPLKRDQQQLAQGQRQLANAVNQLAQAVHEVGRAGSVEAVQRASDSHELLVNSGIALAIVAVLALLVGWLVAGRMLRPIRTITRKAQRISSASLHERLALGGPQDELKELGDTLDDLFARLDAAFDAQRQFVANASHELRAPLTRQRALIQVALADPHADFSSLRAAHERVLASEQHLEEMIDGLLALTRGQAGLEHLENLDVAAIASQAMLVRDSRLARLDLDARTALDPAPVRGDPRLLERLVANLLDNAIRHNMPGGHVELATGTRDRRSFLWIANSGPIIGAQEIQRLFEPFQRLDGARTQHNNGHGLGLSIVRAIADAHGVELTARARTGGGLEIDLSFQS